MPTDSSCYFSITASRAIRKQKVFLNITGVILRVLTFDGRSCLGNIFEQCLTVTLNVQTQPQTPKIVCQPADLEDAWWSVTGGKEQGRFYQGEKHLKGEAHERAKMLNKFTHCFWLKAFQADCQGLLKHHCTVAANKVPTVSLFFQFNHGPVNNRMPLFF